MRFVLSCLLSVVVTQAHVMKHANFATSAIKGGEKAKESSWPCPVEKGELVFSDEFNTFNLKTWKHEITLGGGGNWEFQQYSNNRSNSFVRNGVLNIQPTLTEDKLGPVKQTVDIWGTTPASACTSNMFYGCKRDNSYANPIMSAKISTYNSFAIKYGRVEVRAKLPRGDWLWPAIWMLPKYEMYGGWPASGEIDIMEGRGNGPSYVDPNTGKTLGVDSTSSALHWGTDWKNNKFDQTVAAKKLAQGNYSDDFHTFGMVWNENELYTYVDTDSNRILEADYSRESFWKKGGWHSAIDNPWAGSPNNAAPFDQEYYLIMNVAVGGVSGFFPDGSKDKPWSDKSSNAVGEFWNARNSWLPSWTNNDNSLKVDWVKVYKS